MRKFLKISVVAALSFVLIVLLLQVALNSRPAGRFIRDKVAACVDGTVEYSSLRFSFFRHFPALTVSLDSLCVSYPHDRFAGYDGYGAASRLLDAGRGAEQDTLAAVARIAAKVNPWKLLRGRIRLSTASVEHLSVFARKYDDAAANWNIFRTSSDTTSSSPRNLPWISVGRFSIDGSPSVIYTDQSDTVYAALRFARFTAGGNVKLNLEDGGVRFNKVALRLDSLGVFGRLPSDTLALALDSLRIGSPESDALDMEMGARAFAMTGAFGRLQIPVWLKAAAGLKKQGDVTRLSVPSLDADVAFIPLSASGYLDFKPEGKWVNASLSVSDFNLNRFVDNYVSGIVPYASDMLDSANLDLTASVDGKLSSESLPRVDAGLDLSAKGLGASLNLAGKAEDALGTAARFKVSTCIAACIDSLVRFIPDSVGMSASGRLDAVLDADVTRRELTTFRFDRGRVDGHITSDGIFFEMPSDSIKARLSNAFVSLAGGADGLGLKLDADTVSFDLGTSMKARVRGMQNKVLVSKVETRGRMVPRIEISNSDRSVFMKSGKNRIGLRSVGMEASATRRVRTHSQMRRRILDSLQRRYPGVSRDSLIARLPHRGQYEGSEMLTVSLDSSITRYLKEWSPAGHLDMDGGFIATPSFPLRTRIKAMEGNFTDNSLTLDTLRVTSGTSDISVKGEIKGLRRVLMGRVGKIDADVSVNSSRINANELLAALDAGKTITASDNGREDDESFVTDTLASAVVDSSYIPVVIVPANLSAVVRMKADSVDYSDLHISPLRVNLRVQDQTLQLSRASMTSNLGDIFLNAFYSTKKGEDINAGLDLKLQDISAEGIIHMLPSVDKMMPALKSFQGDLNCELSATTQLDSSLNVVMPTLDGVIKISGENLYVADAGDLRKITRLLLFKNKDIGKIENMNVSGVIHDNSLVVYPFELMVDRYSLALQGVQGFDRQMDYHVSVMKSPFLIPFGIRLFGNPDKMKFRVTAAKYHAGQVPAYSAQLDTVKLNVRTSIMDIFRRGAASARRHNSDAVRATVLKYSAASMKMLSEAEQAELDSLMLKAELEEQERSVEEEIDSALESSKIDIEAIMRSRAEEQEKRRSERKAERNEERQQKRNEKN